VIKGQAWNIVQSLRHSDEGPLELTRRKKVLVWDDELEIPEEGLSDMPSGQLLASPQLSVNSVPLPRRTRSQSSASDFPPPIRRTSTDARPVPFAAKFQRVHPGTTGVTVLEHLERLDAVEASLKRLGGSEDDYITEEEEEEVDVGESSSKPVKVPGQDKATTSSNVATSPFSPPGSPLPTVHEVDSYANSIAEEDLVAMSKSTSHVEVSPSAHLARWSGHGQSRSTQDQRSLDWMQDSTPKRTVIVERLEVKDTKPLCSCW